jgi:copper homeostasis protein CutC
MSDGLIITGISTGKEPDLEEVKRVRKVSKNRIIIGSGITKDNLKNILIMLIFLLSVHISRKEVIGKMTLMKKELKNLCRNLKI